MPSSTQSVAALVAPARAVIDLISPKVSAQPTGLLYFSVVARKLSPADLDGLIERARLANRRAGVTSALLFDQKLFCHYLEGPASVVNKLFRHIEHDVRHACVTPLSKSRLAMRRLPGRALDFYLVSTPTGLSPLTWQRGPGAVQKFFHLESTMRRLRSREAAPSAARH